MKISLCNLFSVFTVLFEFLFFPGVIHSQVWEKTNGPIGGGVNSILFLQPSDRIVICTDSDGIYISDDNGSTFTTSNTGITEYEMTVLAQTFTGSLLVGTNSIAGKLFRSDDNAKTWIEVGNGLPGHGHEIINIATSINGDIFTATPQNIYKSTDNGVNFSPLDPGFNPLRLVVDITGTIYATAGGTSGVFKSTDGGSTWANILTGFSAFSIMIQSNGDILVGTSGFPGDILKSTDMGVNWVPLTAGLPDSVDVVTAFEEAANGNLYAGLRAYDDSSGVYRSTDNGQTWTYQDNGWDGEHFPKVIKSNNDDLFVALYGRYGFWSAPGGGSWQSSNNGIVATKVSTIKKIGDEIWAGLKEGGVQKTTDDGVSWTDNSQGLPRFSSITEMEADADGNVFTSGSIIDPLDGTLLEDLFAVWLAGSNEWTVRTNNGLDGTGISSMTVNQNNGDIMVILHVPSIPIPTDVPYLTTDKGLTFLPKDNGAPSNAFGLDFDHSLSKYYTTGFKENNGNYYLFETTDNGESWAESVQLTTYADKIRVSPTTGDIAVTLPDNISKIDLQGNVTDLVEGWPTFAFPVGLNWYQDKLFAGTGGLSGNKILQWREDINPAQWDVAGEFINPRKYKVGVDISFDNPNESSQLDVVNIYTATEGGGVWKLTGYSTSVELIEGVPEEYKLYQNYPNPFNPNTTINFSIPEVSFVSLKIFNSLGEEIETLVAKELSAGNYNYDWNAEGLTSGIYFYKMQTNKFTETKKMILIK